MRQNCRIVLSSVHFIPGSVRMQISESKGWKRSKSLSSLLELIGIISESALLLFQCTLNPLMTHRILTSFQMLSFRLEPTAAMQTTSTITIFMLLTIPHPMAMTLGMCTRTGSSSIILSSDLRDSLSVVHYHPRPN